MAKVYRGGFCLQLSDESRFIPEMMWRSRLLITLLAWLSAFPALSQSFPVTDRASFLQALATTNVINNFQNKAVISLAAGQTIPVTGDLTIDGGASNVVFSGEGSAQLFLVYPKATLKLVHLQLYDGSSTAGVGTPLGAVELSPLGEPLTTGEHAGAGQHVVV